MTHQAAARLWPPHRGGVVARVRCVPGEPLTVATLNTRGVPLTGSQLAERYAAIGAGVEAGGADVVCCQEVLTYWHLRLLVRRMRSFRQVSYRPGPFGPHGGLVTFSRRPVSGTAFRRFGRPPPAPGVPTASWLQARLKGALATRLARPELCGINNHPVGKHDGDWSEANRFYPLHRAEFAVLARVVNQAGPRAALHRLHPDRRRGHGREHRAGVRREGAARLHLRPHRPARPAVPDPYRDIA